MKTLIITGGASGLGYESVKHLANKDYQIIIGTRNKEKALDAIDKINQTNPSAKLHFLTLDLTSRESIEDFAKKYQEKFPKIDILVNNAGVFLVPFTLTKNNQELQFETNFLGHFYLTHLLIDYFNENGKIINLSSLAHKRKTADIHFDNLNFKNGYKRWPAYEQSKLACTLFGVELDRRLRAKDSTLRSILVHPGVSQTELFRYMPLYLKFLASTIGPLIGFSKASEGAWSINRVIEDDSLQGGDYIGPTERGERRGKPGFVALSDKAKDPHIAKKLWDYAEQFYDIDFTIPSKL